MAATWKQRPVLTALGCARADDQAPRSGRIRQRSRERLVAGVVTGVAGLAVWSLSYVLRLAAGGASAGSATDIALAQEGMVLALAWLAAAGGAWVGLCGAAPAAAWATPSTPGIPPSIPTRGRGARTEDGETGARA
jgi:hypothetical protein